MEYGFFDDSKREYVITTPQTPLPWINYLGCQDFFSLTSNTGGGYSFYRDAKLLRLTRYRYNNLPLDSDGHHYYIKDGDTVWSPSWQPVQTPLDSYRCRHGMGYTIFAGEKNGIVAQATRFVPLGDACEVTRLTLTNHSDAPRTLQVFGAVEFCLWNAVDDSTNFQRNFNTGEVEVAGNAIYHKTEYRERRNHYAIYATNTPFTSFDTSRDAFLGAYRTKANPIAVENGACSNSVAHGWSPVGVLHHTITLQPQQTQTLHYVLGYVENPQEDKWEAPNVVNKSPALALLSRYQTAEQIDAALSALADHWQTLLSKFTVQTQDAKLDRMVNIWNQYQCMVTFNLSRSASYFESGTGRGMGFRDSCQDILGFVHLIPDRARQRILDIAATQFPDGSSYHQYQPLTKQGNADIGSGFNDDPLWLVAAVSAYLRETGDVSILNEAVAFDCDTTNTAPLLEHVRRSVNFTATHLGSHGLPLIGRADWNDCLNLNTFSKIPGESFQTAGPSQGPVAESVFIGGMFVKYGREYADICALLGLTDEAAQMEQAVSHMTTALLDGGWDGAWFRRAYDAFGNPVGSAVCEEGKIYIEPQGMCVMAGVGVQTGYADKAMASVEKYLDSQYGIVLHQPAYTRYHLELGEISSYPPGYKENAGIFCHNNPWVSCGECVLGHGNRAFQIYQKTCPAYLEPISDVHRTEPYVYSQMIAGKDAPSFGEAKNSWLTGTAAWTFVNISQYILGVQPTLAGLTLNPCIPAHLQRMHMVRHYRGVTYDITVYNPDDFLKLANLGFSDVYIGDDLGFDLKRLSKVAKELQVKLRVFPNAAHSVWNDMPSIKKFFIKPEDIAIYEDFIDVIEFFCNTPAIEKTLYSIYKDRMKWTGSLGDIISGLNLDLTSNSLVDNFTLGRINCARKCLKGNACNRCDKALELADHMKEHKMELTPINKKEGSNGKRSDSETRDNEQNT